MNLKYIDFVKIYSSLEKTTSKLEKASIISKFLEKIQDDEELKICTSLIEGRVFPKYKQIELGVATQLMIKAISKSTGFSTKEIEDLFRELGDLGSVAEHCIKNMKQKVFIKKSLSVKEVYYTMQKIGLSSGEGSQEKKLLSISYLLNNSQPEEAKYIVRTILEELRVGVAEGILIDAISEAFLKSREERNVVEFAWNILTDFSEVVVIAKNEGKNGLLNVKPVLGRPIQVMLGLAAESIEDVVNEYPNIICEFKYDGFRAQIHKDFDKIWIFSRRQEDVTNQFPDIVECCKKNIKANQCIVEGEIWAIDEDNKPLPFQKLSQRIHRKYEIEKMIKEIPVQLNLFDIVFVDGKTLFNLPLKERRNILFEIVREEERKIKIAESIIPKTIDEIKNFYKKAKELKQEGIMIKNLDAPYIFGRHVGGWYKIKETMESLDLVIIGATWGEGARARWLTSYLLACRDENTGKLLSCGMMSTGLTEEEYQMLTDILSKDIIKQSGRDVIVKPRIVIEVGYQEIQKSPNYESGYALRFPRFIRIRDDKSIEECDTLSRVDALFKSQGRKG
ncbi:MAG: ATP-dependent DNA ligase [Candidatus Aenigmarchaeota archaeon]|nr:ATP-dependent DNA ligase [Candidatus Aenigmarchaeota archaeon]MDW8149588.1 ATP-dependent DNA ligase [Candidatus Aenigmarchaeota archaeon]